MGDDDDSRGWGRVSNFPLAAGWRFAGGLQVGGYLTLFLHNTGNGRVAYWKTENGKLINYEQGDGWGIVAESVSLGAAWDLVRVSE